MAISTEKLLTLAQFQTGLQASKNYTDAEIVKVNTEVSKKAAQTSLDETNGRVSTLETGLSSANTTISENKAAFDAEVLRAKAAEEANATAASTADAKAVAAQNAADAAQSEVDALELEVATVKGNVGTNTTEISTLKGKVATLEASGYDDTEVRGLITANTNAAQANAEAIDAIEADYLKAADKTALQDQITANANAITVLTDGVDAEKVDGVKELIDYVEEHGTEVTGMKSDISTNASGIEALQSGKADKATSLSGYGIADAYTKTEADSAMVAAINSNVTINVATDDEVTAACTAIFGA